MKDRYKVKEKYTIITENPITLDRCINSGIAQYFETIKIITVNVIFSQVIICHEFFMIFIKQFEIKDLQGKPLALSLCD